jgi:aldehyde:ferredoxin oxidoreductase
MKGGFAGKVLFLDLGEGGISSRELEASDALDFGGGLGLGVKLASERITPAVEALDPANPVVLSAGPLVGTSLPATARCYAVTRLPAPRTVGWCGGSGAFGSQLKYAGFDHVVITGRAERPTVLSISDDRIELVPAEEYWGQGVRETTRRLKERLGRSAGVMAVGPAGEAMVSFALAMIDQYSTLGRGGFGAVMGSKNLKAVVARGSGEVRVADRRRYRELSQGLLQSMREYPYLKEWQDLGLVKSLPIVPAETYRRIRKRRLACPSCPIGDKDMIEIPDGDLAGLTVRSTSAVNLFTPMIYGFTDYREAVKCSATLDDLGLDMFEFFSLMDFAKTLVDNGIAKLESREPEIRLNSLASMEAWAGKICRREGLGEILAAGAERMVKDFGGPARELAPPIIKGMVPYVGPRPPLAWDRFGTMELGQLLDPRGPHVGASGSPTYFAVRPRSVFPKHLRRMGVPEQAIARIMGGHRKPDGHESRTPPSELPSGAGDASREQDELNVGALLKYSHTWFMILGSLGICARAQVNRFYHAELCAALYEAVTGVRTQLPDLQARADRAWRLLHRINENLGLSREDNPVPRAWIGRSGFKNYVTAAPLSEEEIKGMVEEYYGEWEGRG